MRLPKQTQTRVAGAHRANATDRRFIYSPNHGITPQYPCALCDAALAACQAAGGGAWCQAGYAVCRATCG